MIPSYCDAYELFPFIYQIIIIPRAILAGTDDATMPGRPKQSSQNRSSETPYYE
ncbi:hypothetical protein T265_15664, partial [Opisthorchis viverrini]